MRSFLKGLFGAILCASLVINGYLAYKTHFEKPKKQQEIAVVETTQQVPMPVHRAAPQASIPMPSSAPEVKIPLEYPVPQGNIIYNLPTEPPPVQTHTTQAPTQTPHVSNSSTFDFAENGFHFTAITYGDPITGRTGNIEYTIFPIVGEAWCDYEAEAREFGKAAGERFSMVIVDYEYTNTSDNQTDYVYPEANLLIDNNSQQLEINWNASNFAYLNSIMPHETVTGNLSYFPNTDWAHNTGLDFLLFNASSDNDYMNGNYKQHHFELKDIRNIAPTT